MLEKLEKGPPLPQYESEDKIIEQELRQEGEEIYSKEFIENIDEILNYKFKDRTSEKGAIVLKDIIDEHIKKLQNLSEPEKIEASKKFVNDLVLHIDAIPVAHGIVDFKSAIRIGGLNCSSSAALLGLILEKNKEKVAIQKVEYGLPVDHALNIVHFNDGKIYLVDARNNIFEDITENAQIEERKEEELKIYRINKKIGLGHRIIPAVPLKEGIIAAYLSILFGAYLKVETVNKKHIEGAILAEIYKIYPSISKNELRLKRVLKDELQGVPLEVAKRIYQENLLTEEKIIHLMKIFSVVHHAGDYTQTKEFRREQIRWRKEFYRKKQKVGKLN